MLPQDQLLTSKSLSREIADQRKTIDYNKKYIREQEALIEKTINDGNNYISQLTREADDIRLEIIGVKDELIKISSRLDDKRMELLGLQ